MLSDGRICFHDFGIVGRLSTIDQRHLRQLVLALVSRDVERMADLYFEMGVAAPSIEWQAFALDLDDALDRYYAVAGSVPRDLLLVAKVFMQVESLCLELDPRFNMLATLQGYVPRLVGRQLLPTSAAAGLARGYRAVDTLRNILVPCRAS